MSTPKNRILEGLRAEWRELGGFGRVMLIGLGLTIGVVVVLGFIIPWRVREAFIDVRADTFVGVAQDLVDQGLVPQGDPTPGQILALENAVTLRLLGGDAVRVKFWSPEGTVLYSDETRLIGQTFPVDEGRARAFAGEVVNHTPDVSEPENIYEQGLGSLHEYYVPMYGPGGEVIAVFGVYEDAQRLDEVEASSRRIAWVGIGIGAGVFLLFMATLTVTNARIITRRADEAERLADQLGRAREDERRRIVGALHDDVGQPLYRVLYGVRGLRALAGDNERADHELESLEELIKGIDGALRTELNLLHQESLQQVDLAVLLDDLASGFAAQTGLTVDLDIATDARVPGAMTSALVRAAREAVTNVHKHADASRISISLRNGANRLVLDVKDDGGKLEGGPGLGLTISRQRLESVGGGMDISHKTGDGTRFRAWVPLHQSPEDL